MPYSYGELNRLVENIGLEDEPEIQLLLQKFQETENRTLRKEIGDQIAELVRLKQRRPFYSLNSNKDLNFYADNPAITVGVSTSQPVQLTHEELLKHVLITGESGSGKTNLISHLLLQLDTPFWVYDFKQDYRHLLSEIDDLLVLTPEVISIDPFQAPSQVGERKWLNRFVEIFIDTYNLLDASRNFLQANLEEMHQKDCANSFSNLVEIIQNKDINPYSRTQRYRETVLNRLQALTPSTEQQDIFKPDTRFDLEELLTQKIVFELEPLPQPVQNLFTELLIEYTYQYRLAHNQRGRSQLSHVHVVDEAKQIFDHNKEKSPEKGIPEIDQQTSKIGEFQEALIVADQEPRKLTDSIKANTSTKIQLPSTDNKQIKEVAESINLSPRQIEFLQTLETGQAVIQKTNHPPEVVQVPYRDISKTVTEAEIRTKLQNSPYIQDRRNTAKHSESEKEPEKHGEKSEEPGNDLSKEEKQLLKALLQNQFQGVTEAYQESQLGQSKASELFSQLDKKEYLDVEKVWTGNASVKVPEFTDKTRQLLEKHGSTHLLETSGRGGIQHRYWQHRLKQYFEEKGAEVELEDTDNGDADLTIHRSDRPNTAIEISTEKRSQRETQNIQKHLSNPDIGKVQLLCTRKAVVEHHREQIDVDRNEKLEIKKIQTILG